jgi:hypothetical protein
MDNENTIFLSFRLIWKKMIDMTTYLYGHIPKKRHDYSLDCIEISPLINIIQFIN